MKKLIYKLIKTIEKIVDFIKFLILGPDKKKDKK